MFLRALFAFLLLPFTAAIIIPKVVAVYDPWRGQTCTIGIGIISLGTIILLWCIRDFYTFGKGTLAPWNPPKKLVIIGLYRFTRNPMYTGVLLLVLGWGIYYLSPLLILYLCGLAIGFHIRIIKYEEPSLESTFGEDWTNYKTKVSRWALEQG